MKHATLTILALAAVCVVATGNAQAGPFTAYNDFTTPSLPSTGNVTNFGLGGTASGLLLDITSGTSTGVTLAVSGTFFATDTGGLDATTGDALPLFGNAAVPDLDERGRMYVDGPLTLSFTGLSPASRYDIALWMGDIPNVWTNTATISDVSSFVNTSSSFFNPDGATTGPYTTNNNEVDQDGIQANTDGYLVRYSNIDPGSDGDLTITITHGEGYVMLDALRLEETAIPEPATLCLVGLGAVGFIARRKRR